METVTLVDLTVEKLVYGGEGLARHPDGQVVLLPWAAAGDEARVQLTNSKKKPLRGEIAELKQPSADRTEPPCSVFGRCGGCQWQHLTVPAQQNWKREIVAETLARIGKLRDITVQATLGPQGDDAWHYRNKVQWVATVENGHLRLGYAKAASHDVIPFDHCWIIPQRLTELAHWLERRLLRADNLERVQARINSRGEILLTLYGETAEPKQWHEELVPSLHEDFPEVIGLTLVSAAGETCLWGHAWLNETLDGKTFRLSSESFFQVNNTVTQSLFGTLARILPERMSHFLDLYAGVGTFAICLSDRAEKITAMEESSLAVQDGEHNLTLNDCQNITYQTGNVRYVLKSFEEPVDVALVDPPRSGCHPEVLDWLSEHVTHQLVYISCDPSTLARDLNRLTATGQWEIELVQPFDMFPQTYHIETLVSLKKRPNPAGQAE